MHKNTLWLVFVLLCIYLTLVFCEEPEKDTNNDLDNITFGDLMKSDRSDLQEEARTRRRHRHHLYHMWGWHALAIAYLVKVKIVIVSFFVGSAIYLGLRYLWPHQKCQPEIILDHPPHSYSHHDHIPYSSDHSEIISSPWSSSGPSSPSFEPYSAYSGSFGSPDIITDTTSPESHTFRIKRNVDNDEEETGEETNEESRQMAPINEEKIGNFMFMFLGLDSKACRRRFICEMEFRSKRNPLTAMAFRVIGRSFFAKYTNENNEMGRAHNYHECAAVNSECVFIENEGSEESQANEPTEEVTQSNEAEAETNYSEDNLSVNSPTEDSNSVESNNIEERQNYRNLLAERRNAHWLHMRGDRKLKFN